VNDFFLVIHKNKKETYCEWLTNKKNGR